MLKKLFQLFNRANPISETLKDSNNVNEILVEHKTFLENGEFIMAQEFELLWVAKNVNNDDAAICKLNDDQYLDYNLWKDINTENLYKKHLPNAAVFIGKNPNIIFHGGCLGCMSQRLHGLERCKGCMFFRWQNKSRSDLRIAGEEAATLNSDELKRLLGGE